MEEKYRKIKKIVERELKKADSGHDFKHVMRVYNLSCRLARELKGVDMEILKLSALLHDIGGVCELKDKSGKTCHAVASARMSEKILKRMDYSQGAINKILHCILAHRYRTGVKPRTKEAKILFDADKIDALGALGVARAYIWIGNNKAQIYSDGSLRDYLKENVVGGRLNGRIKDKRKHNPFFEYELKLKHLPRKLYTESGRKIARKRLKFMELFFKRLKKEIKGNL